ncbi:MAG: hypothetical protein U1F11_04745 [Steroidobacteraceae bacterium]
MILEHLARVRHGFTLRHVLPLHAGHAALVMDDAAQPSTWERRIGRLLGERLREDAVLAC